MIKKESGPNTSLSQAIAHAEALKIFPAVAARVQTIAEDPNSSLIDLEKAVSLDTTLSAQILKIANSAFFGLSRKVASLRQALLILGFDATRDMAIALAALSLGRSRKPGRYEVWRHVVSTAILAQRLARRVSDQEPSELFVAGILHDIGKLIMLEIDEKNYLPFLQISLENPLDIVDKERSVFKFDHAALGGACLEKWRLPIALCQTVQYHHTINNLPSVLPESVRKATAVVGVANILEEARNKGQESLEARFASLQDTEAAELLKLNDATLADVALPFTAEDEDFLSTGQPG
jgi:putative nucleotidyltransferase with HDIG domain